MALRVSLVWLGSLLSPALALHLLLPPALAGTDPARATPASNAATAPTLPTATAPTLPTATAAPAPTATAAPAPSAPGSRELILDRQRRILRLIENGQELRRFPVAVGMAGWETPVGSFRVIQKTANPIWEHPEHGKRTPAGGMNPLGSRWIGFHRDCSGRKGWDGERMLDVKGCVVAGFHGTPHRWTVGHAVSHGCVRLYDEDVQALFDLVAVGTPVTVLP